MANKVWFPIEVVEAIANWVRLGLHPGGFAESVIANDRQYAFLRAHPHLKSDERFTFDELFDNLFNIIPPSLRETDVTEFHGYVNMSQEEQYVFKSELILFNLESYLCKEIK